MDFNITADMTKEMAIKAAHEATAVPSMIILYMIFGITLFLVGLGFKERDSRWGRFFWIWAATMMVVGTFLTFLAYSPTTVQFIADKCSMLWS